MHMIGVTGGVGCGKSAVLAELKKVCACDIIHTDAVANAVKEPGEACYNEIVALLGEDVLEDVSAGEATVKKADKETGTDVHETGTGANRRHAHDGVPRRIDRAKMAAKIFDDAALLKKVNAVLHPAVRRYVLDTIKAERTRGALDILFIEAALLLESGYVSAKKTGLRTTDGTDEGNAGAGDAAVADAGKTQAPEEMTAYGVQAADARVVLDEMWYVYAPKDVRRKRLKQNRGYSDEKIDAIMSKQLTEEQFRAGSDFEIDNGGTLAGAVAQARKRIDEIANKL